MSETVNNKSLEYAVEIALQRARSLGASEAEALANHSKGLSVTVRQGDTEIIEHNNDKSLAVTVYFGHSKGSVSTSNLTMNAIIDGVKVACDIAKNTEEDHSLGLADKALMATRLPELSLFHQCDTDIDRSVSLACACEQAGFAVDRGITNSEGAAFSSHQGARVYANSHGFVGSIAGTTYSLSCTLIANDEKGMQRDYWYDIARDVNDLASAATIGQHAAHNVLRRCNPKAVTAGSYPIIFAAAIAPHIFKQLINAICGSALYRNASFLLDHLGEKIFPDFIHIHEQPHLLKGLGSAAFDAEGVATRAHDIVLDGVLQSYVLDSYSARKLAMKTTANAGGVHNLTIDSGKLGFDSLIKQMNSGILVTETMGMGTNIVTGDYSQGASGFWVENGTIQHPIDGFTIAGNLADMFSGIQAIANDIDTRGNIRTGSVLIDSMQVAG